MSWLKSMGLFVAALAILAIACEGSDPTATVGSETIPPPSSSPAPPSATVGPEPTPPPSLSPAPPSASFSVDVESGLAPLTVRFINTSEQPVTSVEWDFGDLANSSDESPTHTYTIAGTYNVGITVTGPGGTDSLTVAGLIAVEPGPAVSVEITPSSPSLVVQATVQLSAVAKDEFGNEVAGTANWTMAGDGGSIDEDGLFTAGTNPGSYLQTVTVLLQTESGELEGSNSVTVNAGPVFEVSIDPVETVLVKGATQTFSYRAFDKFGNEIPFAAASWTAQADVAEIDDNGVLTAGAKSGVFPDALRVDVVYESSTASATANLLVNHDTVRDTRNLGLRL